MATLVPSLVRLRTDFNTVFPGRDKSSDGWIGDTAHQGRDSDHNPDERNLVHAIDVDANLGSGVDMRDVVEFIVARCRSGKEKRLTYVIHDRTIWSATQGWTARRYSGDNPHTAHAHFSAGDTPARERDTGTWHLEEVPVALTAADKKWIADQIAVTMKRLITQDEEVRRHLRAIPWQYVGGGIPQGMSTLGVLNQTYLAATQEDEI
ncbi:hypothetical protein OHA21_34830 [Actinoplanes sp. NBC_00393]|uniref:hypothetical protein n=1 Tax=Actinoplanes sp. NBC_00393 TaxID=2975953 RepID=UPI002E1D9EFB